MQTHVTVKLMLSNPKQTLKLLFSDDSTYINHIKELLFYRLYRAAGQQHRLHKLDITVITFWKACHPLINLPKAFSVNARTSSPLPFTSCPACILYPVFMIFYGDPHAPVLLQNCSPCCLLTFPVLLVLEFDKSLRLSNILNTTICPPLLLFFLNVSRSYVLWGLHTI